MKVDLSSFSTAGFDRGASSAREILWILVSLMLFRLCPIKLSGLKCWTLRRFGAKIGRGVVIKPQVKITFPWKLEIGDFVWLGEECWMLNLERIVIGSNVCISQRAFLCTGSHDHKRTTFDLIVKPIVLEDGVWIGAGAWIGPGVEVGKDAVLAAGSVAVRNLEAGAVYRGNPAEFVKARVISAGTLPQAVAPISA